MENIYTSTNATFTTANGETVSYQEIFDAAKKSVEIYEQSGAWYMDKDDLEDLFQDIVFKAIKYHGSFDSSKSTVQTWVNRIARNAAADALADYNRRHRIRYDVDVVSESGEIEKETVYEYRMVPVISFGKDGEAFINPETEKQDDGVYGADCEVESKEAMKRILTNMASLNERYKEVLSLQLEGLKPKNMAERLGCSADAASILLFRARKALKKELGNSFLADCGLPS